MFKSVSIRNGNVGKGRMERAISSAQGGIKGLRFLDKAGGTGWPAVSKRFDEFAVEGRLLKDSFGTCIGMAESKEFAEELFVAMARRRGIEPDFGVTKEQLQEFWGEMTDQNFDSRLRIFFDMCDKNGDGMLSEDEVKQVIILSAAANKLGKLKGNAATYASLIMEELDPDHKGYIELWQLETLLQGMLSSEGDEKATLRAHNLAKTMIPSRYRNPVTRFFTKASDFTLENWRRIWVLSLWLILNISLFLYKFYQYKSRSAFEVMGYCVCVAKGAAETLKLNMALILLPVCRNTITKLRSTSLGTIIPFDDNINFHKVIALAITIGALVHTFVHIGCDFPRLTSCPEAKFMSNLGPYFDYEQPTWLSLLSSVPGYTGIVMIVIMAFCFTLATHYLEETLLSCHHR